MQTLEIIQPDDWHLHLRDQAALAFTVPASSAHFGRAIIMPNLNPPVKTLKDAQEYHQKILEKIPQGHNFQPLMCLYLTQETRVSDIQEAHDSGLVYAVKLYPAGATTHSQHGVSDIFALSPVLKLLETLQMPLLLHGEVVDPKVDVFDREAIFIDTILKPLLEQYPRLKVVLEHITTAQAVDFVMNSDKNVAATITPQHLLYNRNHMLVGGIKPHFYCLPILKRNTHQQALIKAATSGNNRFFLGTDSAPHAAHTKENACGCAGCFSAPFALSLYAQAFDQENALDKLEGFASLYGADFYGLPRHHHKITLVKKPFKMPEKTAYINGTHLINLGCNETFDWQEQSQ